MIAGWFSFFWQKAFEEFHISQRLFYFLRYLTPTKRLENFHNISFSVFSYFHSLQINHPRPKGRGIHYKAESILSQQAAGNSTYSD